MAVCLYHWSVNTSYLWVQRCCARSQYPAVYGQLSFSTYRWPEQQSHCDVTFIYVYATSVLSYCACKQQSFHPFGTGCLTGTPLPSMPSSQLAFISSCVRPKISLHDPTNSNSYQLVSFKHGHTMMLQEKSTVILYFPRIMFHLCGRRGPADPHQFSDTSNSRRPHDCLFRHLNTALVHPPPSITLSSF